MLVCSGLAKSLSEVSGIGRLSEGWDDVMCKYETGDLQILVCTSDSSKQAKIGWDSLRASEEVSADVVSFGSLISAFEAALRWEFALDAIAVMHRSEVPCLDVAFCSGSFLVQQASGYLSFLHCKVVPDAACFNAAMRACKPVWEVAILILHGMARPDVISYSSALSACEKPGRWDIAIGLLELMRLQLLEADVICWSSGISACEKSGYWELATRLLHDLPAIRCSPDTVSINSALSACEKAGKWRAALQLFFSCYMHVRRDTISLNAVLSACEKAGQWQMASHLLESVALQKIEADTVSYNAVVASCEDGKWEFALALLYDMLAAALLPDTVTYNAAISAAKDASWMHAVSLLHSMIVGRSSPDEVSVGGTMTALQHGRDWHASLSLLRNMCEIQVYLSPLVYSVAISTCQLCQEHLQSAALFWQMRRKYLEGVSPCLAMLASLSETGPFAGAGVSSGGAAPASAGTAG